MFPKDISIDSLNALSRGCLVEHLGIEFTEIGDNFLQAKMPVDERTKQPFGLLHGGASVVLAETLGSVGSSLLVDIKKQFPVGIEINANHVKAAKNGFVYGTALPIHIGKLLHIWDIKILNEQEQVVCVSRLTTSILDRKEG